jgi:hypothetical protein
MAIKLDKSHIVSAIVVGTIVAIGLVPLSGLFSSFLGFIPSVMIAGVSVPHGVLAAGVLAFAGNLIVEKFL